MLELPPPSVLGALSGKESAVPRQLANEKSNGAPMSCHSYKEKSVLPVDELLACHTYVLQVWLQTCAWQMPVHSIHCYMMLHDVTWCYMPLPTVGIVSRKVFFEANDSSSRQLTGSRPDMAGRTARWDTGVATSRPAWSLDHRPCVHREHRELTNHYQTLPKITKHTKTKKATWSATWMPHERHRSFLED